MPWSQKSREKNDVALLALNLIFKKTATKERVSCDREPAPPATRTLFTNLIDALNEENFVVGMAEVGMANKPVETSTSTTAATATATSSWGSWGLATVVASCFVGGLQGVCLDTHI
jgi:hypothetical protein